MPGYYGNESQQRLQAQAEAAAAFIETTPGSCQTGRTMGCDDVDRLGWQRIESFLDRDGVCGFRLIAADRAAELGFELVSRGYRFDTWDVYLAEKATAVAASKPIVAKGVSDEFSELRMLSEPGGADTRRIQTLMSEAGVVPFSGSMLVGAVGPALTVALKDGEETPVAAAHGYLPHNTHSAFHRYAWGGLVAVAAPQRGRGLGNFINARMIMDVFDKLAATHVYELVSSTNIPSRRMVEACGLRHEPNLVCGVATRPEGPRLTR